MALKVKALGWDVDQYASSLSMSIIADPGAVVHTFLGESEVGSQK